MTMRVGTIKQTITITPEAKAKAMERMTSTQTITINMGGIHIANATPQEAQKITSRIEKAVKEALLKIEKDKNRRAY